MHNERTSVSTKHGQLYIGYRFAAVLLLFWIPFTAPGANCEPEGTFEFNLSGGYCIGGLHWNIADADGDPNILSELTWSKLQILQIEATGRLNIERFTILADVGYGYVPSGDVQDSDYDSNDRTGEFSRSYSDAKGGYLLHTVTGLGYRLDFYDTRFRLIPMIGIALHRQAMKMSDGVQVISVPPSSTRPLGPIPDLDSSYVTNWLNLWIGMDADYRIASRLSTGASISVHPSLYYAEADWNLRTDYAHPVSFVHKAFGLGFSGELRVGFELSRRYLLEGRFAMDYWFTGSGVDETYWATGGSVETPLNEVVWKSARFFLSTVLRL